MPKGTPKAVVEKLGAAIEAASKTDAAKAIVKARYMKSVFYGPGAVDKTVNGQVEKFSTLVAESKAAQK